jgi:acyl-CoA synthetase (AMP-forming)/AMP-acid ligase II
MRETQRKERAAIDAAVLEWIKETPWQRDEEQFDELARRIFYHQFEHCLPYARFAQGRGVTPQTLTKWREIPAVPAGAFKEMPLRSFPEADTKMIFRTSGTSGSPRGELHLDTLTLYEASALAILRTLLLPDLVRHQTSIRVLAPSALEAPDSSLSLMFSFLIDEFGAPESGFDIENGEIQLESLKLSIAACTRERQPILLCGTSFAFVHLLDRLSEENLSLSCPAGSRIMETGGFKGRSREMSQDELHADLAKAFGIPSSFIINQYGMTELGSQFYDSSLVDPEGPRRKLIPPWVDVRIIDPETSLDVVPGKTGMVTLYDLANTGSVAAIQTADIGRSVPGDPSGFEVLGREKGAEERGCSIAADEMLSD